MAAVPPPPFTGQDEEDICGWMFFADARMNLEQRLYKECAKWCPRSAFSIKVEVGKEAGLFRSFCLRWVGMHTQLGVCQDREDGQPDARALRGVLVPFDMKYWHNFHSSDFVNKHVREKHEVVDINWKHVRIMPKQTADPPSQKTIYTLCVKRRWEPDHDYPILQTALDVVLKGAFEHSKECATEICEEASKWNHFWVDNRPDHRMPHESEPMSSNIDSLLRKAKRLHLRKSEGEFGAFVLKVLMEKAFVVKDYREEMPECEGCEPQSTDAEPVARIFGYGSLVETRSRKRDAPSSHFAVPVKLDKSFGCRRRWNFRSSQTFFTALGLEKRFDGAGEDINGVIFNVNKEELKSLCKREAGYEQVAIQPKHIQYYFSWQRLSGDIPTYVFIQPHYQAKPADFDFPIVQSYVDVCISGCFEHGDAFARDFLSSVGQWPEAWLNDRQVARRPWLHQPQWAKIDEILMHVIHRRQMEALLPTRCSNKHSSASPSVEEPEEEFVLVKRPRVAFQR